MSAKAKTILTSKGQLTFPAELRKAMKLKPGDQFAFEKTGETEGKFTVKRRVSIFDSIDKLELPKMGQPLTQTDIDKAVDGAISEKFAAARKHDT